MNWSLMDYSNQIWIILVKSIQIIYLVSFKHCLVWLTLTTRKIYNNYITMCYISRKAKISQIHTGKLYWPEITSSYIKVEHTQPIIILKNKVICSEPSTFYEICCFHVVQTLSYLYNGHIGKTICKKSHHRRSNFELVLHNQNFHKDLNLITQSKRWC